MKKGIYLFVLQLFLIVPISSQSYLPSVSIESGAVISSGKHSPFWFYSNQYGKISTKNNSIYLLPSIYRSFKDSSKIDYSYNLSPLFRYDGLGRSYIHQWYGELKFHFIHFTAGAKEEFYGNQDSTLSSGSIIWSKNARPMPKLKLEVPNYTTVPFTCKLLEFKGGIAHGWFDDNEYNKNVWLHHKYFYLRLGGKLPVHVSYGLHHFAQWGGTNYEPYGDLPNDFDAFKNVFLGRSGNPVDPNTPWAEWFNVLGNHIGSRNFGAEIDFSKTKVSFYWQNIFEDGSGKAYRNIKDGLFGISIRSKEKDKLINGFVYEFFNTTDQSGRINATDSIKPDGNYYELGGNDNYLNNGVYLKGWSFKEMNIGNPLITSPAIISGDRYDYIRNNKVLAHHFGLGGSTSVLSYKLFYTYSLNYGTNFYPISPKQTQHSFLFEAELKNNLPGNLKLSCALGGDFGDLYRNNFGVRLLIRKQIL